MKRKFLQLSAFAFFAALSAGTAQVTGISSYLDGGQVIFAKPYSRPLTGIDILRKAEPLIFGQSMQFFEGPHWLNEKKYVSKKSEGSEYFSELQRLDWENNNWVSKISMLYNFSFDASTKKLSQFEATNISKGQGSGKQKFSYRYDSNGRVIEELSLRKLGVEDTGTYFLNFKRTIAYDENGRRSIDTVWTAPNGNIDSIRIGSRNKFFYNAEGLVEEERNDFINPQTGQWTDFQRTLLSYENGRIKEIRVERWNQQASVWEPASQGIPKENFSFDEAGRLKENISYQKVGTGLITFSKTAYDYFPSGNLKEIIEYTPFDDTWTATSRYVFSEDNNGKLSAGLGYAWNTNSWETEPSYRYVFSEEATPVEEKISSKENFVSPNPAQDFVVISLPENFSSEKISFTIKNILGITIARMENISPEKILFDRNGLPGGTYFYEIRNDKEKFYGKFLFE